MEDNAMTTNLEEIYGRYREAGFADRLNIYLQFPDLRNDFLKIEEKDRQPTFLENTKSQSKGLNRINGWIRWRFSFLW
jgi:hypothetical protein